MENKSKLEPSENGNGKSKCPICKEDATLVCSGCQSVSYCSVDHQKKHWKLHQLSCVFFHIKDDPSEFTGAGKYCEASRDLKAGTIILEELPVFQMPTNYIHDNCITCGMNIPHKIKRNASNSCPKCNWPVCGTACAEFPLHADNECQVFVANRIPYPKVIAGSDTSDLTLYPPSMRAYAFMIQNPERWKELMEMMEWGYTGSRSLDDEIADALYNDTLEDIVLASSNFPNITSEDLPLGILPKLFRLAFTQGYFIAIQEDCRVPGTNRFDWTNMRHRVASYVCKTARHFVHSCSPNCFWTVGTFPDFKMQIRTSVAVKKGEKLTVSRFIYKAEFANGTRNRQKEFRTRFHLPCRCGLCLDPTEFGTYQSAVICPSCKTYTDDNLGPGFLLPIDPLDIADDALSKCHRCMKITTDSTVYGKLEEIFLDLHKNYTAGSGPGDKVCEAFIEMYRNKLVHPNHWLIQAAGKLIRNFLHPHINGMNMEQLSGFEKLMYFLLDLKDKTVPGLIHERILIVMCLSEAICRRLVAAHVAEGCDKGLQRKSREDLSIILEEIEKCQQYQKEALVYYKHPPNIERGQTVDDQLSTLRSDMQDIVQLKFPICSRLAEIDLQRMHLGIN